MMILCESNKAAGEVSPLLLFYYIATSMASLKFLTR